MEKRIGNFVQTILNSYSQVFFSRSKIFALILMLVTFIDLYAGLAGLLAIVTTAIVAYIIGFDDDNIQRGLYGFNSLLTALALGIWFAPGPVLYLLIILSSVLTLLIAVTMQGVIGKYNLPYLSIPFIISAWVFVLAASNLTYLGLSERGIFTLNEMYTLGGSRAVSVYNWWNNLSLPQGIRIYLLSLGAILFQYNLLAGLVIAVGLLFFSRIAFTLSLLGFFSAYFFYDFVGADISELSYTYIGFNYILTAVAIGGFFIIPSIASYIWAIVLVPIVALISMSLTNIFAIVSLPVYALPFNMVVLLFLYSLMFRTSGDKNPVRVTVQQDSPEKNLYLFKNDTSRFRYDLIPLYLPFFGKWEIAQGYSGDETHLGEWRHALDFVITGKDGSWYSGDGKKREDYYCFKKPVLAPGDGIVETVINDIEDNEIGVPDIKHNWGNTIIIRHHDTLYTSLNHLLKGSINVKAGDRVKKGDKIALCGNSGRSTYPHLHFQVQAYPAVGSPTLEYPFSNFLQNSNSHSELKTFSIPEKGDKVSAIEADKLLSVSLGFRPGEVLDFLTLENGNWVSDEIEVFTNEFNYPYLESRKNGAVAYFLNDGSVHTFSQYYGKKSGLLYFLFLGCFRVPMSFKSDLIIDDNYPVNLVYKNPLLFFQDFLAPFFIFLRPGYQLKYSFTDSLIDPSLMRLEATVTWNFLGTRRKEMKIEMTFSEDKLKEIKAYDGEKVLMHSKAKDQ